MPIQPSRVAAGQAGAGGNCRGRGVGATEWNPFQKNSPAVQRPIEHLAQQDQLPQPRRIGEHPHQFICLRRRRRRGSGSRPSGAGEMMVGQTGRAMAEVVRKSIAHMAIDFRLAGIQLAKLRQGRGPLQAAGSQRCVGERGAGRGGLSRPGGAGTR